VTVGQRCHLTVTTSVAVNTMGAAALWFLRLAVLLSCGDATMGASDRTQVRRWKAVIARKSMANSTTVTSVCSNDGRLAIPTLFVLGAQKSGSSALYYDMVGAMPSLLKPVQPATQEGNNTWRGTGSKEMHFFDMQDRYEKGAKLYSSYFPPCSEVRAAGSIPLDGTPDYFGSQGLPTLIPPSVEGGDDQGDTNAATEPSSTLPPQLT